MPINYKQNKTKKLYFLERSRIVSGCVFPENYRTDFTVQQACPLHLLLLSTSCTYWLRMPRGTAAAQVWSSPSLTGASVGFKRPSWSLSICLLDCLKIMLNSATLFCSPSILPSPQAFLPKHMPTMPMLLILIGQLLFLFLFPFSARMSQEAFLLCAPLLILLLHATVLHYSTFLTIYLQCQRLASRVSQPLSTLY